MARKKRVYEDDDGRTIADMSGVSRPHLMDNHPVPAAREPAGEEDGSPRADRPWESNNELTPAERAAVVLGALKAALLIGLAFIVGLGAVVLLMVLLW